MTWKSPTALQYLNGNREFRYLVNSTPQCNYHLEFDLTQYRWQGSAACVWAGEGKWHLDVTRAGNGWATSSVDRWGCSGERTFDRKRGRDECRAHRGMDAPSLWGNVGTHVNTFYWTASSLVLASEDGWRYTIVPQHDRVSDSVVTWKWPWIITEFSWSLMS